MTADGESHDDAMKRLDELFPPAAGGQPQTPEDAAMERLLDILLPDENPAGKRYEVTGRPHRPVTQRPQETMFAFAKRMADGIIGEHLLVAARGVPPLEDGVQCLVFTDENGALRTCRNPPGMGFRAILDQFVGLIVKQPTLSFAMVVRMCGDDVAVDSPDYVAVTAMVHGSAMAIESWDRNGLNIVRYLPGDDEYFPLFNGLDLAALFQRLAIERNEWAYLAHHVYEAEA